MKLKFLKKRFLSIFLSMAMFLSMFSFLVDEPIIVKAAEGEPILDLDNINQNPSINFSAIKTSDGNMFISNDASSGGFSSGGINNTSYLITSAKYSGDFSVEARLKVLSRTITGTGGVVGVGAFSGTGESDAFVSAVARGDNGARSYYKKSSGQFGAGSPNLASSSNIGDEIYLKVERQGDNYTVTINNESKTLSGLDNECFGDMYLGFVVCGAVAEVSTFIIKTGETIIYDLSQPSLPRPIVNAIADDENIQVAWTEVEGAESYTLEYKKLEDSEWIVYAENIEALNQTVEDLTSMTPYEFRVKVNGGPSNTLYSAPVMAIPGFNWSQVSIPSITEVSLSEDGREIIVKFDMEMGALGATDVDVEMYKDDAVIDTKSIKESTSVIGERANSVKFTPNESGEYTFIVKASRDGEEGIKESSPISFVFELPLEEPEVRATAVGTGSIKIDWEPVKEAEGYRIEYKKENEENWITTVASTTDLSYVFEDLEVGTIYEFKVVAFKGEKSALAIIQARAKEIEGEVVEWKSIIFGQSVSEKKNSIEIDHIEDTVTITAVDGGGKVTGSHDGISYYYTEIDSSKNFELSADIEVNFFAKETPDNQEAFGIMARDAIGEHLNTSVFPSNMVMVGGYRGELQSVFRNGVTDSTGAGATMEDVHKFGDRPSAGDTYRMTLKKTNTGYHVSVDDSPEKIYYRPKQLEVLDPDKIYVGFFAARVASITVSNISIKTSDVATDPPGEPEPPKPIEPSLNIVSLTASSTPDYELKLLPNVKGQIKIKQDGQEIYSGLVEGDELFIKHTTLVEGDNVFNISYTPDSTELITDDSSIELTHIVTLKSYGKPGGTIYVSPEGNSNSSGAIDDPIDIYSAIRFIGEGQTIYLRGGEYKLSEPIIVERGNDGTSKNPKVISAYPGDDRPVLDFSSAKDTNGFTIIGNHWKLYGIDITNAPLKGLIINGNYNVVELVNTYANGDTGLQISRFPGDERDRWPSHNLILHCTSYDNIDASENNADGFAAKLTCGEGNIFRGCIAHNNCDDGWDLYSKLETGPIGAVIVENCVAYGNGTLSNGKKTNGDGNGFKMGGEGLAVKHVLRNSLAFDNDSTGITSNSNPALIVENCTSVDNGLANFDFSYYDGASLEFVAKNNISFRTTSGTKDNVPESLISDDNYFYNGFKSVNASGQEVMESDFKSVEKPTYIERDEYGKIAIGDFMVLSEDSRIEGGAKLDDYSNITIIDYEVNSVISMIESLPSIGKLTLDDKDVLELAIEAYNDLTNEQKLLIGEEFVIKLTNLEKEMKKLVLEDKIIKLEEKISKLTTERDELLGQIEELEQELTDLQMELRALMQDFDVFDEEISELKDRISELEKLLAELSESEEFEESEEDTDIIEPKKEGTHEGEKAMTTKESEDKLTVEVKDDKLPKTGYIDNIVMYLSILIIIALSVLLIMRGKKKHI